MQYTAWREAYCYIAVAKRITYGVSFDLPELELHCESETCNGKRIFKPTAGTLESERNGDNYRFISYICKNCSFSKKTYALKASIWEEHVVGNNNICGIHAWKLGEHPWYAPEALSPAALAIIEDNRELLQKGIECENSALGVAAFEYFRRVIERQRKQVFRTSIEILQLDIGNEALIADLKQAQAAEDFAQGIKLIKQAWPENLKVHGENPLAMLHRILRVGLNKDDAESLEYAAACRSILLVLAEKLQASKDESRELKSALALLQRIT